ncbi:MAG TPA: electron transfer flavoprotein subunit alpha/FixB family protein [Bdellovibrionota bacterium]|nr:electron transfer flavoprotein subunit alpha/FixB family protein [Bdellovibrionota bacterium]
MAKALVLVEYQGGKVKNSSLEVVHAFASKGFEVSAIAFGASVGASSGDLAKQVGGQGAKTLLVCEGANLAHYQPDVYAATLAELFKSKGFNVIAGAASALAKDLFPTVAAKADTGIAVDVVDIKAEGDKVSAKRPMLAGKYSAWLKFKSNQAVISVRPNVLGLGADSGASAAVETVSASSGNGKTKVTAVGGAAQTGRPELSEAARIVSAGRSIKAKENFKMIEELADAIGASVGASRAAVDAGLAPHEWQVGQTGKTVNPNLYIACGISGAIQHMAGMKTSKVIVAINSDKDAPIFQKSDYGAVGDMFEVVPALTAEFKKLLAGG